VTYGKHLRDRSAASQVSSLQRESTMPALATDADAEDEEAEEQVAPLAATILLVDDRPANLMALEAVLEPLGHKLVLARSGEEALQQILKQEFALILMDVQMPDLDGYQTVALIKKRERSKDIPVIFVSAVAKETEHISKGYEYGAVDYMTKPFDPDVLRAKVSVLVALYLQAERIVRQRDLLEAHRSRARTAQVAREAAETANRMKDEFLAMVSHELRGPLNAILGWASLLQEGGLDEARTRQALATIQQNVHAQSQMIEDLMDVSRIVRGKLHLRIAPVRVASILEAALDAVRPTANEKGVSLSVSLEADLDAMNGDAVRLQQVFWNILSNAIKFTERGGNVHVELRNDRGMVEVRFRDSGRGIDPSDLPRVFDRFWQNHRQEEGTRKGLGLGLAIVRHLVELHGGQVRAESEGHGRGSTFVVNLPVASGDAAELHQLSAR
jgi:signal transduction histidine kinase